MAGADVSVTDARIAKLLLEFAAQLGKVDTTDTVTIPVARHGRVQEADLLLGPASQITLTENDDDELEGIEIPNVADVLQDLQQRLDRLRGIGTFGIEDPPENPHEAFPDFGDLDA